MLVEDKPYQPTPNDEQFFRDVQRYIFALANVEQFTQVGRDFDKKYSYEALLHEQAKKKWALHRHVRDNPKMEGVSRSRRRKQGVYVTAMPERYGNGKRVDVPWLMYHRMLVAAKDIEQMAKLGFDPRPEVQRRELANQILLMTWLLTDPDGHDRKPLLTDFQRWGWKPTASDQMEAIGFAYFTVRNDTTDSFDEWDHRCDRWVARVSVFSDYPQWGDWARWAWNDLNAGMDHSPSISAQRGGVSYNLLRRCGSIYRALRDDSIASGLIVLALGGIIAYFLYRHGGINLFDPSSSHNGVKPTPP